MSPHGHLGITPQPEYSLAESISRLVRIGQTESHSENHSPQSKLCSQTVFKEAHYTNLYLDFIELSETVSPRLDAQDKRIDGIDKKLEDLGVEMDDLKTYLASPPRGYS